MSQDVAGEEAEPARETAGGFVEGDEPDTTTAELVDVACPDCGTEYHLSAASAGQQMRCPNNLCGATFAVPLVAEIDEPPLAEIVEPPVAELIEPTAGGPEVFDARIADEPAPGEPPAAPSEARGEAERRAERERRRQSRRLQRSRRIKRLAATALLLMGVASAVMIWKFLPEDVLGPNPDRRWAKNLDFVAEHKWSRALREFEKFQHQFPDDPRNAQIPFFVDLCKAGRDVYSTTGDAERGLAAAEQIFRNHRDHPAYKDYCADLYLALARLVERFSQQASAASELKKIERARRAHALLQTVGEALRERWVPKKTAELGSQIEQAERTVRKALARREVVGLLTEAGGDDPQIDADAIYARVERILHAYPALRDEQAPVALLRSAYAAEPSRVRFLAEPSEASLSSPQEVADSRGDRSMVVVWGEGPGEVQLWSNAAAGAADAQPGQVVLALARGVLHAFSAADGRLLWVRRLGIDSHRLPARIAATDVSPATLLAVSTDENRLLALEESTGRLRWQYPAGDEPSGGAPVATLTIVDQLGRPRGLLPTADGEVQLLELARGRRLGRFQTGHAMTVGGTYDPESSLAFFPADARRIFALDPAVIDDPQRPACPSILLSDHASGALRAPPVVLGPYLIVVEAADLEQTRLRAFWITERGFRSPTLPPQKELSLDGWAGFHPHCAADRITLVTDSGRLGVFGVNLDNTEEALYRLVDDGQLGGRTNYRPLAVHAQEHLLWVMAGGALQKLAVDVVSGTITPLWQGAEAPRPLAGIPLHEAQTDRFAGRFFLTTTTASGRVCRFTAVEADSGNRPWQRQLGVMPLGDPIAWHGGVLLLDRTGRTLTLRPGSSPIAGGTGLPEGIVEDQVIRLGAPPGPIHLVAPLAGGRKVAVVRLELAPTSPQPRTTVSTVELPQPLHGRPCVCGEFLVAPCRDGRLYRVRLDGSGAAGGVPLPWSQQDPGPSRAEVYCLGGDAVLLVDAAGQLRRLVLQTARQVSQWKLAGRALQLPSPPAAAPLVYDEHLFVFDSQGTLHQVSCHGDLTIAQSWPLAVKAPRGPFVRDDYLLAIGDGRKLICIDRQPGEAARQPRWIAEFAGRIRGEPLPAGDTLLVADNSRHVTGIRLRDGRELWKVALRVSAGPAATPVPYGKNTMLVPLADGTLLQLPIPGPSLARAGEGGHKQGTPVAQKELKIAN